jgi:hypothetical protein
MDVEEVSDTDDVVWDTRELAEQVSDRRGLTTSVQVLMSHTVLFTTSRLGKKMKIFFITKR